ncbi:MAG: hypothetical protein FJW27_04240 [Acidimicrobiia bacterium]|nr:hypothetical protein [Acidimicrobiia bacterium]
MDPNRRYVFRGYAVPFGGRIGRLGECPNGEKIADGFIEAPAAAIGVVGGRSRVRFGPRAVQCQIRNFVRFRQAEATVIGQFDLDGHYKVTCHELDLDELATNTQATTAVDGLEVGTQIRLRVGRYFAGISSTSKVTDGEPSVIIDPQTGYSQVSFQDRQARKEYPLAVEVDVNRLNRTPTQVAFMSKSGQQEKGRTVDGQLYDTIVTKVARTKEPFPNSRIDGNSVVVPGWGTLFLGDVLISPHTRRLTMLRAHLGV